jgi:G:T/U-mismatch repair DNA glycosylase
MADTILSCERKEGTSSDLNLTKFTYNTKEIGIILKENEIKTILFTSRFAEKIYKRHFKILLKKFPNIQLKTLPSPSPRYARISFEEKVDKYKKLLPKVSSRNN